MGSSRSESPRWSRFATAYTDDPCRSDGARGAAEVTASGTCALPVRVQHALDRLRGAGPREPSEDERAARLAARAAIGRVREQRRDAAREVVHVTVAEVLEP